jgi:hypothetical protein
MRNERLQIRKFGEELTGVQRPQELALDHYRRCQVGEAKGAGGQLNGAVLHSAQGVLGGLVADNAALGVVAVKARAELLIAVTQQYVALPVAERGGDVEGLVKPLQEASKLVQVYQTWKGVLYLFRHLPT